MVESAAIYSQPGPLRREWFAAPDSALGIDGVDIERHEQIADPYFVVAL